MVEKINCQEKPVELLPCVQIWTKKSFDVQAAQVTEQDMETIAEWCGGRIYIQHNEGEERQFYIQFTGIQHKEKKEIKAFVGDWITFVRDEFRLFHDTQFKRAYDLKTDKYAQVLEQVEKAMGGNSYMPVMFEDAIQSEDIARTIVNLFEGER
jgi:hypothetical protein